MIPKSWNEVTIEQFVSYSKTLEETPQTDLEKFDLLVKRACLLSKADVDEVMALPQNELYKIADLIKQPLPTKIRKYFRLNGQLYKFFENPRHYSGVEYMAVMNACKDKNLENLHRILFTVCKPVKRYFGKKIEFKPEEIEQKINEFKQLPISIANPIAVFFWSLSKSLTDDILEFSESHLMKMTTELDKEIDYLKSTAG